MRDNKPAREKIKGQIRSPRTSTKEFCAKPMCKEKTAPQFYHDDLNCKYRMYKGIFAKWGTAMRIPCALTREIKLGSYG